MLDFAVAMLLNVHQLRGTVVMNVTLTGMTDRNLLLGKDFHIALRLILERQFLCQQVLGKKMAFALVFDIDEPAPAFQRHITLGLQEDMKCG